MMNAINKLLLTDKHKHPIDRIAKINAIVSGIALFPQLVKVSCTGDVAGFSSLTYLLIALNSLVWIFYAVHRKLFPLVLSSALNLIAASCILFFIVMYK